MRPMRRVNAYFCNPTPTRRTRSKARYRDVTARGVGEASAGKLRGSRPVSPRDRVAHRPQRECERTL